MSLYITTCFAVALSVQGMAFADIKGSGIFEAQSVIALHFNSPLPDHSLVLPLCANEAP